VGWRFRKSVKILPGVRLNFGKGGFTSTTIGGRWFKTNVGGRGVRHTVSVPGTGVSYQTDTDRAARVTRATDSRSNGGRRLLVLLAVLLALVLLALIGVGILVVLTRPSAARRLPTETSAPPAAAKTQAGSAAVSRGRS
jgi:hypothetical protein